MRLVVLVVVATACGRLSFDPVDGDVTVGFERDVSVVDETSGTVTIPVRLSAAALHEVTVAFDAASGTAISGTDFTGVSAGTLTFAPGETEQAVVLTITEDGVVEPDETFDVTLTAPSGAMLATATHTITISAEALPRINFESGESAAAESGATTIAVVLDAPSTVEISVDYALEGDDDFTLRSGTIMFAPGETRIELALGEVQDALDEGDDGVVISLHDPVNAVIGDTDHHTHTIIDDDPLPEISILPPPNGGSPESGIITFTAVLSAPSGRTVTAFAVKDESSSIGGDGDVAFNPTLVTFLPGETMKEFTATVIADTIDEPDEILAVTFEELDNATHPDGGPSVVSVTILDDDDPPTVTIEPADSGAESVAEGGLTVTLSGPSGRVVTVPFLLIATGTTASSADDFGLPVSMALVFDPGITSRVIILGIVDDALDEPDETIRIGLGTPTNATLASSPQEGVFTIADDDNEPSVQFALGEIDTAGAEGPSGQVSTITYAVVLSAPSTRTITLDIDVTLSTATSGDDFTLVSVPITFDPGKTTNKFELAIDGDDQPEPDETVVMSLANIVNAQLGTIGTRTHTINDDDGGS